MFFQMLPLRFSLIVIYTACFYSLFLRHVFPNLLFSLTHQSYVYLPLLIPIILILFHISIITFLSSSASASVNIHPPILFICLSHTHLAFTYRPPINHYTHPLYIHTTYSCLFISTCMFSLPTEVHLHQLLSPILIHLPFLCYPPVNYSHTHLLLSIFNYLHPSTCFP